MPTRKSNKIIQALVKKGFKKDNTNHFYFWYYYNGKKTSLRTRVSHGINEYGSNLLGQVKIQMKLNDIQQLLSFIDCDLKKKQYQSHLFNIGFLRNKDDDKKKKK